MYFFGLFKQKSGKIAKERLSQVLLADRAICSSNVIENMEKDMKNVLYKYVEVASSDIKCRIVKNNKGKSGVVPMLIVTVPFRKLSK